ncbi:hypothetical protein GDO86_000409 [Hymenochirus boettgeri]|uniref:PurE domain-containing protein n=1 Tax=Hymenochirus boettgeri TaxID=247094 RepID=A0A8T2KDY4_9PIPI|nr:hypothetical protein GDO86_000409 [Hymenochirus boettgeri]
MTSGSFLGRNVDNIKGHRFSPPQVEMFKVDDCNKLSKEHFIGLKLRCAGLVIGKLEIDIMIRSTVAIFEILEKNWLAQDCTLVYIKIKFGVDVTKKEIILVDIIDCDSPGLLLLENKNQLKGSLQSRVVVLMESTSDLTHCEEIKKSCTNFGMSCELRVTSAHTGPEETLDILSEYEGDCIPTVFIAVAGESNGLGAILAGNTAYPVVNCPPLNAHWGAKDIWSSLRVPSGLGCSTVLSPEAAAQFAARIFGINDHMMWSKLRSCALNSWIALKQADANLREFRL